jgi:hypothetical protein
MQKREIIGWEHGRAVSMTAARFEQLAFERGLLCIGQEVINWAGSRLTDCISLVTPPGSLWERPNVVSRNSHFLAAGLSARSVSAIYVSLKRQ